MGNLEEGPPIVEQTPEQLEATRLRLLAKQEWVAEQQEALARQLHEKERVQALRCRGHQVNDALKMREREGVQIFLTPSHNLVVAALAAEAIDIPEGTPGYDNLRRLKIFMEEATL